MSDHPHDPADQPPEVATPTAADARRSRRCRGGRRRCRRLGRRPRARVPAWAGRAVLGVAVRRRRDASSATPLGLGARASCCSRSARSPARVQRPAAIPSDRPARRRRRPTRDRWTRVWWALAAGLALVPVLRAAAWVVVPALFVAAALASLAATGGRRWGAARRRAGRAVGAAAARAGARRAGRRARRLAGAAPGRPPAAPLLAARAARGLRPAADERRRGVRAAPRRRRARRAGRRPAGRARARARRCSSRSAARCCTRGCARRDRAAPGRSSRSARLEWALAARRARRPVRRVRRAAVRDAVRRRAPRARHRRADLRRVRALGLRAAARGRRAHARRARRGAPLGPRRRQLLRVLLAALCLLTLVVLASALKRLGLYEETYGFTRLRFAAHAALLYLGALFVPRPGHPLAATWLPRARDRHRRAVLAVRARRPGAPDRRAQPRALRAHGQDRRRLPEDARRRTRRRRWRGVVAPPCVEPTTGIAGLQPRAGRRATNEY